MVIVSGNPVIVTFLSELPSSQLEIFICAPDSCLWRQIHYHIVIISWTKSSKARMWNRYFKFKEANSTVSHYLCHHKQRSRMIHLVVVYPIAVWCWTCLKLSINHWRQDVVTQSEPELPVKFTSMCVYLILVLLLVCNCILYHSWILQYLQVTNTT